MRSFTDVVRGVHQKQLLQSTRSEDCFLIRKKTNNEITKTVELEILCFQSQRKYEKPYPQSAKLRSNKLFQYCSNAFQKHWNNTLTICLKVILRTRDIVHSGSLDSPFRYRHSSNQSVCSNDFFWTPPSELICIISGGYTRCDFYGIFSVAMICLPSKNFEQYIFSSQQVRMTIAHSLQVIS